MKTEIFSSAISKRQRLEFLYGLQHVLLEPYYISSNKKGEKVIFGRVNNSSQIKMFEYNKIFNIKVLSHSKFSPIIPILRYMN